MKNPSVGFVIFAKNKKLVSTFYRIALGLTLEKSDHDHDVLASDSYQIVIHAIAESVAKNIEIAVPPKPREETPIKPVFVVSDFEQLRRDIEKTGGFLKPTSQSWLIRGFIVLDGWDPEGNIVQFKKIETSIELP